ncbi:sucrase ferredoxin [Streptacidiphilus pinicola]|uniref:Sucrase ferredoxin n=1 Tax=Streptacidiphilus pinicola TaxID=2219663 RepID=A0A2X0IXL1_9ACTN|nr:sucrase ferredoxin [Streptacidiphilus pinicola]RAG82576.1 sucrase ferredoxin [Streptacidiphilus pinicola]
MSICARVSEDLAEPLAGSAPRAAAWLLIEQTGPWGPRALTESHFHPELGRDLQELTRGTGVEIALIRRPGKHADRPPSGERIVYLAHTAPGRSWVRTAHLRDPHVLRDLDYAAVGAGDHGGFGADYEGDPLAFVCTNGRRDRCCALLGRPLASELAAAGHAQVWEVTHLGGHRFAPTMLVLPYGFTYGRLTAPTAKEILDATHRGRVVPEFCRGRSSWDRPGQAAELAVRQNHAVEEADALTVTQRPDPGAPDTWTVQVHHTDGRAWQAEVRRTAATPARPESCVKAPSNPDRYDVLSLGPLPAGVGATTA